MTISLNSDNNAIISPKITHSYCKHTKKTTAFKNLNCKKSKVSSSALLQSDVEEYEIYKRKVGQSFDKIMAFCKKQPAIQAGQKKSIKNKIYKRKVGQLFDKIFNFCTKQIPLNFFSSEEDLNKIFNSVFIKTLFKETKKDKIRNFLEQNPCVGEYWKDLHKKSSMVISLQDLQKLYLCLESFCYPIPKTAEEMLIYIQKQIH
ncbi:MAG: hypothetical protein ACRDAI_00445 [Candidatus Rhabdochlamydia sp.]